MRKENWMKKQLREGRNLSGIWAQSGSAAIVEAAVYAGWDIVIIDNEHGFAGLETTINLIRAVENSGGHVVLRVPWNDPVYLKRVLDIGVQSLMIPMIADKAAAEAAVAACSYPPRGWRGNASFVVRASGYGAFQDYGSWANEELLIMAQIEQVDAVDNIEEIAGVDGIDMLFIGPNDLAGSMGRFEDLNSPEVIASVAEAEKRIVAAGKMLGGFPLPGCPLNSDLEKKGYRFLARHSDIWLFRTAAAEAAGESKQGS
jgi:4-hydroxy-2-oxoheptanedioate aldolase